MKKKQIFSPLQILSQKSALLIIIILVIINKMLHRAQLNITAEVEPWPIFPLSREITLTKSHLTTFIPQDFCSPNKDQFSYFKNLTKPNDFGDTCICEKLLSDPYVLFLVMAAMFFDKSKILTTVLCRIPQGSFMLSLVSYGKVVSEEKIFERNNIKNSKIHSKRA